MLLAFIGIGQAFAQSPDPGTTGALAVSKGSYDFGDVAFQPVKFPDPVEVRGEVYYPTSLSPGPFPLILFLHGRHETCYNTSDNSTNSNWPCGTGEKEIPSFQGYEYLAQQLASNGYIVVSIGANSISATDDNTSDNGMAARAELIQHHLDLWSTFNTTGGTPFGTLFAGKIDMKNIGTMGHSRGGEGVIQHALYNRGLGSPYGIKAVLAVAPTDFNRPVLTGIPVGVVLPYCDGDVSNLQGVHYYDDARYSDPKDQAPKHTFLMMGANHNFFNTSWTPGLFAAGSSDDWDTLNYPDPVDLYCSRNAVGNKRFDPPKQRAALLGYASAFFRTYIGNEKQFAPIIQVDDSLPPVSSTLNRSQVYVSYHPPNSQRLDVNRTDAKPAETINTLTGNSSQNGLATYGICGDIQSCLGMTQSQEPHNKMAQLQLAWNSVDDWYENKIPANYRNLSQYHAVQFRASVNFKTSVQNVSLDFLVQLHNVNGDTQTVHVSDHSKALYFPPGTLSNTLPHSIHNTIKIPLAKFNKVDLKNIDAIRFLFKRSAAGAILISDLTLSSDSLVSVPPLAVFSANVTTTCVGDVVFADNSINNPVQWRWDFGDGTTSTVQNPSHKYISNGTYAVKLVVSNLSGKDSVLKTSYIVVNKPAAPTGTGDKICSAGTANLTATGSGSGSLVWYTSASGGTSVNTGTTYSPTVSASTVYYVDEEVTSASIFGGKLTNTGGGGNSSSNNWNYFDVLSACTLKTVRVYAQGAGNRTIELWDKYGNVVQSKTVNIPTGTQTVTLNFLMAPGKDYSLRVNGTKNLYRNSGGVTYPYNIGTLVSITRSSATTGTYYYYFYNWEVQASPCISNRTAVTADVGCTGIANSSNENSTKIYPNPAQNCVVIEKVAGADKMLSVELLNLVGEKIAASGMENTNGVFKTNLNIENVPSGIYFIYINAAEKHWVYKIVKE